MLEQEKVCTIGNLFKLNTAIKNAVECVLGHIRDLEESSSLPDISDGNGNLLGSLCQYRHTLFDIFDDFTPILFNPGQSIPITRLKLNGDGRLTCIALEEYRSPYVGINGESIYTFPFIYADAMPLGGDAFRMIGVNIRVAIYPGNQEAMTAEVDIGFYDFLKEYAEVIEGWRVVDRSTIMREGRGLPVFRCSFHKVSCLSFAEWSVVEVFHTLTEIENTPTRL